jgi:hypothetical protein
MKFRILVMGLTLAGPPAANAGHGLMNAFGEVEWLPDPGRTPDQIGYTFDLLAERAHLALAATETERYTLAVQFAAEKLAEIEALVKQNHTEPAHVAVAAYREYIGTAAGAIAEHDTTVTGNLDQRFAIALLEHQYVMSVNYLDLPRTSRTIIAGVIEAASDQYTRLLTTLDDAFKASLFFKEEEVRWSWEVAQQADQQGL